MPPPRRRRPVRPSDTVAQFPTWVAPQLTKLVEHVPAGEEWAHEIKLDGYRMHARIDRGKVRLLTRTGLDWSDKYPTTIAALERLPVRQAYLDGELCGVAPNGVTSFSLMQSASDDGRTAELVYFVFDLLYVDGENLMSAPLIERKTRLQELLPGGAIRYVDHQLGQGPLLYQHACRMSLEGIVSKQINASYKPNDRGLWVKTKCLNREEFVVVGWTDPEGTRPRIGALLLAYYDPDGRLTYAGRAATGMSVDELERVWHRLQPLATRTMPLDVPPPRTSRFGSPLFLSRVHWVRPKLIAEINYLTWTQENLLRQVVYLGLREDKPAREVRRSVPYPKTPPAMAPKRAAPANPRSLPVPAENILQLLPDAVVPSREALTRYWTKVAPEALNYLGRRPLKLVRHVHGTTFYHRGPLPPVPATVHQLRLHKREAGEGTRVWVDDLDGLLGLLEMGVVEVHPWGAMVDDLERPDTLVFDFDPGEGVGWDFVTETAFALRDHLAAEALDCWPKVTGGKGLHVMVPIERTMMWDEAHEYCRRLAQTFIARDRTRYTRYRRRWRTAPAGCSLITCGTAAVRPPWARTRRVPDLGFRSLRRSPGVMWSVAFGPMPLRSSIRRLRPSRN
jgi:bifunctional non-homologous end joining protein LigD